MASVKLVKRYGGAAYTTGVFTLQQPVENTDWLSGRTMDAPVKAESVVVRAGSMVVVEAIGPTMTNPATDAPEARVLFRVTEGPGQPWYWHRLTLRPSDYAALNALTLRFTRPSMKR